MKIPLHLPLVALAVASPLLIPMGGQAQQVPDWLLKLKLPNSAAKASMTPTAWGAGTLSEGETREELADFMTSLLVKAGIIAFDRPHRSESAARRPATIRSLGGGNLGR